MGETRSEERDFVLAVSTYGLSKNDDLLRHRFSLRSLDWGYVLGQLLIHRLISLAYTAITDEDSFSDLPRVVSQWLRRLHFPNKINQKILLTTATELTAELTRNDIVHCYLKGAILQADYYPPWSRQYNDLDLLIAPHDLSRVSDILHSMGFVQGWVRGDTVASPTRHELVNAKVNSHEIVPFCRRTQSDAVPYVNVDVQFELAGTKPFGLSVSVDDLLNTRRSATDSGLAIPNLPPQIHLVLLCTHQQMHVAVEDEVRNANDMIVIRLSDVARVATAVRNGQTWGEFFRTARDFGALELVRRCLRTVATIYGREIAAAIISESDLHDHATWGILQQHSDQEEVGRATLRDWLFNTGSRST